MSKNFDAYAAYYDLLYQGKDYAAEARYVLGLIRAVRPDTRSLLELGSGTGKHAVCFAESGIDVTGIDRSPKMVELAKARAKDSSVRGSLSFLAGDVTSYVPAVSYDAAVSLFHVMSYQTSNSDLIATFKTVARSLESGGVFVFDCWHGPGVLTDLPTVRTREFSNQDVFISRVSTPTLAIAENVVTVNYEIVVKRGADTSEIRETHRMRYLFTPEVELLANLAGLSVVRAEEWLSGRELTQHSWNASYVLRK